MGSSSSSSRSSRAKRRSFKTDDNDEPIREMTRLEEEKEEDNCEWEPGVIPLIKESRNRRLCVTNYQLFGCPKLITSTLTIGN